MSERELKAKVTLEGAKEAAEDQKRLAETQAGVTKSIRETAPATQEAAAATQELSIAESDLSQVLDSIVPGLGQVIGSMAAASKIAADLGSKNIDLSATIEKVTQHVTANAKTYALLGAGGAAFAGLVAVYEQWKSIREEIAAATAEAERLAGIQAKMAGEREATRQALGDALIAAQKPGEENLAQGMNIADSLTRAGLGAQAVPAGAYFAGTDTPRGKILAAATAADLGLIDFADPRAGERTDRLMADEQRRRLILEGAEFRGAQGPAQQQADSLKQFFDFKFTRKPPWAQWLGGPNELIAEGDPSQILASIQQQYGLEGQDALTALRAAQKLAADRNVLRELKRGSLAGMGSLPFGEQAFQRLGEGGDWEDIAPGVRGVAESLADRMMREQAAGAPGLPQGQANVQFINKVTHHHHGTRVYANRNGIRGGNYPSGRRDRSGRN